jgi:hypothetical protein
MSVGFLSYPQLIQKNAWTVRLNKSRFLSSRPCLMDMIKALLGNGSVNMFQRATMETVSQWTNVIARCQAAASAPMGWRDINHMTCVFCVVRAEPI